MKDIYKANEVDIIIASKISEMINESKFICDIGFGNTILVDSLNGTSRNIHYCGIDMDDDCVNNAKNKNYGDNICFLVGNVNEMVFPTADCFVLSRIIHHLTPFEVDKLLRNIINSLIKPGKIIIVDSIRDYTNRTERYLYLPFDIVSLSYKQLGSYGIMFHSSRNAKINNYWCMVIEVSERQIKYNLDFWDN